MTKYPDKLIIYSLKPLNSDLIIFASEDFENIKKHLALKKNKDISDWIKKHNGGLDVKFPSQASAGGVYFNSDEKPLIFFVKQKKRDWEFYETIIHEIIHLIDGISTFYGCTNEAEFRAYMAQSIFKDLRKLLK